jgi:3-phosphoshikimate 1-carboxyvinyltransferase
MTISRDNFTLKPGGKLIASITVPGDKSITHRALILSAISSKQVTIKNWLSSLDCLGTLAALSLMGVRISKLDNCSLEVEGVGLYGLSAPKQSIEVGNSGTALRLLTGILAAQAFDSVITGDASLRKRPMQRIITPLQQMGAKITAVNNDFAPLNIQGGQSLKSINYTLPVASAQVKSAILLADLYAQGKSQINENIPTRNHTELMLNFFQDNLQKNLVLEVPGDISSAAFFIVGATIATGSDVVLKNIGVNPTRTGVIEILNLMGANIKLQALTMKNNEVIADLRVKAAKLKAINIPLELVPKAIDEFPIIAIAAACAAGVTVIRGVQELRYKESDRISAITAGLTTLGIKTEVFADGLAIIGGQIKGGIIDSFGDHRIAMAFTMAALVAQQQIIIQDTQNIATSFPEFLATAQNAGLLIAKENCYV